MNIESLKQVLAGAVDQATADHGLVIAGKCIGGDVLVLPDRRLPMQHAWHRVDPDEQAILEKAVAMVGDIARAHGAGRVWTLTDLGLVHLIEDDGRAVIGGEARLRACYFHEAATL